MKNVIYISLISLLFISCFGINIESKVASFYEVSKGLDVQADIKHYSIDKLYETVGPTTDKKVDIKGFTNISGWIVDPVSKTCPKELWVSIDSFLFPVTNLGISRPGVAKALNNENLTHCGFSTYFPSNLTHLHEGHLSLILINREQNYFCKMNSSIPVNLKR